MKFVPNAPASRWRECITLDKSTVYEITEYCRCSKCIDNLFNKRTAPPQIWVYVKDIERVDEAYEIAKNFDCSKYEEFQPRVCIELDKLTISKLGEDEEFPFKV